MKAKAEVFIYPRGNQEYAICCQSRFVLSREALAVSRLPYLQSHVAANERLYSYLILASGRHTT
jgi:hypothetical protein